MTYLFKALFLLAIICLTAPTAVADAPDGMKEAEKEIRHYYRVIETTMSTPTIDNAALVAHLEKYLSEDFEHLDKYEDAETLDKNSVERIDKYDIINAYRNNDQNFTKALMKVEILGIDFTPDFSEAQVKFSALHSTITEKNNLYGKTSKLEENEKKTCTDFFRITPEKVQAYKCECLHTKYENK